VRHIVALSGGESSAAVAVLLRGLAPMLYFNDTKWEHPDLYRYLNDLSAYLGLPIVEDSDGRDPEQLFKDEHSLANNRMPFCSRILKADRLQKYAKPGDQLYFGIGSHEVHRAARIRAIYTGLGINSHFPLIERNIDAEGAHDIMVETGIPAPALYAMGFEHNNCGGGCVRQGARQWKHLLRVAPETYAERERVELDHAPHTFLKDISLTQIRKNEEAQMDFDYGPEEWQGECIGMCGTRY
jgi:hypothetical protein